MELFYALGLPMLLLFGLVIIFMDGGVPDWIKNLNNNSSTAWNFGIILMLTVSAIVYFARR